MKYMIIKVKQKLREDRLLQEGQGRSFCPPPVYSTPSGSCGQEVPV